MEKDPGKIDVSHGVRHVGRTRRVAEGLGASWLSLIVRSCVQFFVTPFYLAHLGGQLMGFSSFIRGIINYFQVMEAGTGPAVAAIVAKEMQPGASRDQDSAVKQKVRAGAQLQSALALLAVLLSLGLATIVPQIAVGLPREHILMAQVCTVIFGVVFALHLLAGVFSAALVGRQLMGQNTLYSILSLVCGTAVGVLVVWNGGLLYGVATGALVSAVLLVIQVRLRAKKLGFPTRILRLPVEWQSLRSVFAVSKWVVVASIGGLLSFQSARVILGLLPDLGMAAVNEFSLLAAVPQALQFQTNRIAAIARPGLTQLVQNGQNIASARRAITVLVKITGLMAAAIFLAVAVLNGRFVPLWVGPEFYAGDAANLLLACLSSVIAWQFLFKVVLEVRFFYQRRAVLFLATGTTTVVLSLILGPLFGIEGIIFAALVAELTWVPAVAIYPAFKWLYPDESVFLVLARLCAVPLAIVALSVLAIISRLIPSANTWSELAFTAAVLGLTVIAVGYFWLRGDIRTYMHIQRPRVNNK